MSLSEIQWTLGHGLSKMVPDYLLFLKRIKGGKKRRKRRRRRRRRRRR
jgi:hypothetical protein